MSISRTPIELVCRILGHLDSTNDLHAAIISSPIFSNSFNECRKKILTSILENIIPQGARKHALAVLKVPHCSGSDDQRDLWLFLNSYFSNEDDNTSSLPRDIPTLTTLAKLASRVSRFERDYFEEAVSHLAASLSAEEQHRPTPQPALTLSYQERTRIQRAFFRFELYCRCFIAAEDEDGVWRSLVPAELQSSHFLNRMQPWEVEEMTCVHEYLSQRLGSIINRMEDEIIAIARDNQVPLHESERNPDEKNEYRKFIDWDFSSMFGSYDRLFIYRCLTAFVSKGLDYLAKVYESQGQLQRDLILSEDPRLREFLPQAIDYSIENPTPIDGISEAQIQESNAASLGSYESDDPLYMNSGFSEFGTPLSYWRIAEGAGAGDSRDHSFALRKMGYVFWDTERIVQAYSTFTDVTHEDPQKSFEELDFSVRESLEHVLRKTRFPKRIFRDITQKYGLKRRRRNLIGEYAEEYTILEEL